MVYLVTLFIYGSALSNRQIMFMTKLNSEPAESFFYI
uniref:Uncharacterized protein n=1 Tax=Anguilla anguilla TaxID=7936 RepID=A0A0E9QSS9_ANGAN